MIEKLDDRNLSDIVGKDVAGRVKRRINYFVEKQIKIDGFVPGTPAYVSAFNLLYHEMCAVEMGRYLQRPEPDGVNKITLETLSERLDSFGEGEVAERLGDYANKCLRDGFNVKKYMTQLNIHEEQESKQ